MRIKKKKVTRVLEIRSAGYFINLVRVMRGVKLNQAGPSPDPPHSKM